MPQIQELLPDFPNASMDVDMTHTTLPGDHRPSMTPVAKCHKNKAEIKAMLDDFQAGLNILIASDFQERLVIPVQSTQYEQGSEDVHPILL